MRKSIYSPFFLLAAFILILISCAKETSYESGFGLGTAATGTLKDTAGSCQGIQIYGKYKVDTTLTDSNYITVNATITKTGIYSVYTDTVNGMWFRDSSFTLASGPKTFKLKGYGKPILPLNSTFKVRFSADSCIFSINPGDTTTTGGIVVVPPVGSTDYFPTTATSNWTYSGSAANIKITATSATKTVNSNVYTRFTSTAGDSSYFRKGSGIYYQYADVDFTGTSPKFIEYIFLKDSVPVNTSWDSPSFTITGFPTSLFIRMTIVQRNVTITVNGKIYNNVIQVKQDYYNSGVALGFATDFYYAKGIGLIKVVSVLQGMSLNLSSFQVI